MVQAAAASQGVTISAGEDHVLAGRARQRNRAVSSLFENKIHRVGGAEAVGDGKRDLVGRWRRRAGIISYAGGQISVDLRQGAGVRRGRHAGSHTVSRSYRIDRKNFGGR